MRRRWRWKWDGETVQSIAAAWFAIGMVLTVASALIFDERPNHPFFPGGYALIAWLGPFALAALGLALYGLLAAALWLSRNPPLRRETESSPDLRERYRNDA